MASLDTTHKSMVHTNKILNIVRSANECKQQTWMHIVLALRFILNIYIYLYIYVCGDRIENWVIALIEHCFCFSIYAFTYYYTYIWNSSNKQRRPHIRCPSIVRKKQNYIYQCERKWKKKKKIMIYVFGWLRPIQ